MMHCKDIGIGIDLKIIIIIIINYYYKLLLLLFNCFKIDFINGIIVPEVQCQEIFCGS